VTITVRGRFSVNNLGLMRTLAEREMGVAALAPSLCREAIAAGRLVPVAADNYLERSATTILSG